MTSAGRPYRSRTQKPCDACRRRRTACIRSDGPCMLCSHRGLQCTFLSEPTPRSRPARNAVVSTPTETPKSSKPSSEERQVAQDPTKQSSSRTISDILVGTTLSTDRTFLYSGSSSDQDPHLLRHLVYDESSRFGNPRWAVWRMGTGTDSNAPTYFTTYPNDHLDVHATMYSTEEIDSSFHHQEELIRLYYTYTHPSYPILDPIDIFMAKRAAKCLPASLLALVYLHGSYFSHKSPLSQTEPRPSLKNLDDIFNRLTHESHTPNIAVVQAILLFLHIRPRWVRAPNHPGTWALSCMLVGIAQDIGLNLDPLSWTLCPSERRLRRVLWWAIFTHDKFISHWLGRPSHITSQSWNVALLQLDDFSDPDGRLSVESFAWANAFIALTALSVILSDVLDNFYSICSNFDRMLVDEAIERARPLLQRIESWKRQYHALISTSETSYTITVQLAMLGLITSIHRAIFAARRSEHLDPELESDLADSIANHVQSDLMPLLEALETTPVTGLWLSYNKGSLTLIGGCLIAMLLASITDDDFVSRRDLLMTFRDRLEALVGKHEFVELPLRRLHLILEELFGADVGSLGRLSEDCLEFPRWRVEE